MSLPAAPRPVRMTLRSAIAEGREAAISIHRFVHSNQSFVIGRRQAGL